MAAETVELHKLKLAELKQECLARGLEAKGNKQDLINRLQTYLEQHESVLPEVYNEHGKTWGHGNYKWSIRCGMPAEFNTAQSLQFEECCKNETRIMLLAYIYMPYEKWSLHH